MLATLEASRGDICERNCGCSRLLHTTCRKVRQKRIVNVCTEEHVVKELASSSKNAFVSCKLLSINFQDDVRKGGIRKQVTHMQSMLSIQRCSAIGKIW